MLWLCDAPVFGGAGLSGAVAGCGSLRPAGPAPGDAAVGVKRERGAAAPGGRPAAGPGAASGRCRPERRLQ